MKYLVSIIFFFIFSCSTLNTLHLDPQSQIPDFEKKPEKQISYINFIHDTTKKKFEDSIDYIKDKNIIIQLEDVDVSTDTSYDLVKENYYYSVSYLMDYIFRKIQQKNPHIKFIKSSHVKDVVPTHTLKIKIVPLQKLDNFSQHKNFFFDRIELQFHIIRNKPKPYHYNLNCPCIELKHETQKQIHIKQPETAFLLPQKEPYINLNFPELEKFIEQFQAIGKGSLNVFSSSKKEIFIKGMDEQIVYKGFTPAKVQLIEGIYKVYSINKSHDSKKEDLIVLREGENKDIILRWNDEQTSSFLNILSNQSLHVSINNEYKGTTPLYISEVYRGIYNVQLQDRISEHQMQSQGNKVLFEKDLFLEENQKLNLFYPLDYYIHFKDFKQNHHLQFWFAGMNSNEFQEHQIQTDGILLKQPIFSSDIILDELRGEFTLSCLKCTIFFYFEKYVLLLKRVEDVLLFYKGSDILKREKVYQLNKNIQYLHFYFDQSKDNVFELYLNTQKIAEENVISNYLAISIAGEDTLLREFFLKEKGFKNRIQKSLYFFRMRFSNLFSKNFTIR